MRQFQNNSIIRAIIVCFLILGGFHSAQAQRIVALTWKDVVGQSRVNNLSLKIARQDYRHQRLEEWKSYAQFLPQITYQGIGTKNIELPEFVFSLNGVQQRFRVGTTYNVSHSLQLNLPLFLGGLRLANLRTQRYLRKSIEEELRGKEADVVYLALQNYFSILLNEALIEANQAARDAAALNLEQVEQFYQVGNASQLDLYRARAQYSSTLPALQESIHQKKLAVLNLKLLLNIPVQDSVVILDTLALLNVAGELEAKPVSELQQIALKERPELLMLQSSSKAVGQQQWVAGSRFLPNVYLSGSVDHQAQINELYPTSSDYTRVKRASITVQFPLFQGAERVLNFQQARIQKKKMDYQLEQLRLQLNIEVEQAYYNVFDSRKKLESLRQTLLQARESHRLASLYFREGIATQLEVLNAQLVLTQSQIQYKQGIFNVNMSRLALLKAIGRLEDLWRTNN